MPITFTTTSGQRINLNCAPESYIYAMASDNGIVKIKYPDVPEFEIYQEKQDRILQAKKNKERQDDIDYFETAIAVLKGQKRIQSHPIFHTLFMEGDIWQVVAQNWTPKTSYETPHFYGLKPGDQFSLVKANWDNGYCGWTSSHHENFDPGLLYERIKPPSIKRECQGFIGSGAIIPRSNPLPPYTHHQRVKSTFNFEEEWINILDPHNVTEGRVIFMGNPDATEPRWFGCERTGKILLPVGRKFKLPDNLMKKYLQMSRQQMLETPLGDPPLLS